MLLTTDTIKELYDYILQREYAEPLSLDEHGMERKAIRTPSVRLRFGRTDPNLSLFRKVRKNLLLMK